MLTIVLESICEIAPEALAESPGGDKAYKLGWFLSDKAVVNQDQRPESQIPNVVLRCHHFVEHYKAPYLDKASCKNVIVESNAADYHKSPLWYKCQNTDKGRIWFVEKLVDEIPVDGVVVSVIFAHKMVEISLPEELIAIDHIEKRRQTYKCQHSHQSENDSVLREEALLRDNSFVGASTLCDEISVTVNEKVEHKAENDGVNFEMDGQTEEKTSQNVSLAQYKVYTDEYHCLDNLIV